MSLDQPSPPTTPPSESSRYAGKRLLDVILATAGLVALSPVALVVACMVRLRLGSPVLFRQERPGRYGVPFEMLKFRTMSDQRLPDGSLAPDDVRLTRLGKALRATSLDELPELVNVLRGEMSLVGPRPILMQYLPLYSPRQSRRHDVRPGLSGWAQVNGRNSTSWEERFELDVWYVEHQSLLLDLKIIVMTLAAVVRRDGISADEHVTMPPFTGSPSGTP